MIKTWQVVLATLLIFVAGLATGGAVAFRVVHVIAAHHRRDQEQLQQARRPGGWGLGQQAPSFGPQLVRRFANQLDLTPEQSARINPIIRRTALDLNRLRRETQLSTALAMERMQDEIADQLTPPQRAKFEDLLSQQRARLQQIIQERKARQNQGHQGPYQDAPPQSPPQPPATHPGS